jgi:D-arabinose 1-dehydrogenase-like Zn-dependent alcohol dehydrogenase
VHAPTPLQTTQSPNQTKPKQQQINKTKNQTSKQIETFKLSQSNEAAARVASGKARYRVVMETDAI